MYRANDVVVNGQRISNVFNTQDEDWHTKYMRPIRGFWSIPEDGFTLPDGRYIPGATKIGINPAVTCRDFEVFGDDVEKFNPDRWLQKDGESKEDYEVRVKHMREITTSCLVLADACAWDEILRHLKRGNCLELYTASLT